MDYDTRRRISDLADDLLDAGNDPPAAVLDELRALLGVTLTDDERQKLDRALTGAITHQIAFADDTPYPDDPRWSPWTRFQKRVADRCGEARALLRGASS